MKAIIAALAISLLAFTASAADAPKFKADAKLPTFMGAKVLGTVQYGVQEQAAPAETRSGATTRTTTITSTAKFVPAPIRKNLNPADMSKMVVRGGVFYDSEAASRPTMVITTTTKTAVK